MLGSRWAACSSAWFSSCGRRAPRPSGAPAPRRTAPRLFNQRACDPSTRRWHHRPSPPTNASLPSLRPHRPSLTSDPAHLGLPQLTSDGSAIPSYMYLLGLLVFAICSSLGSAQFVAQMAFFNRVRYLPCSPPLPRFSFHLFFSFSPRLRTTLTSLSLALFTAATPASVVPT